MNVLDLKQKRHHEDHYKRILEKGIVGYDGFINPKSIWYWMHTYCLNDINCFFKNISSSYFLTVGDGYCGREAGYIKSFGHKVHASDIETCLIELAKTKNLIDEYSCQDMNSLSFEDNTFDYVLCKESLHHLSKPYQGIYEMMRVSKKGIIIIEPNGDNNHPYYLNDFEDCGNYGFSFNSYDLIKVGMSMGYRYFVITYSNMFYGQHNIDNILNNKIEEEKSRLKRIDDTLPLKNKPLLTCFLLKNKEDFDAFQDESKFIKITKKHKYLKSQFHQDEIVLSLLNEKSNGYFIELGAADGVEFSNTYYLEKMLDWKGLLIEPNPNFYKDLQNNRTCSISNKLCWSIPNLEVDFLLNNNMSGIVNDNSGYWVKENLSKDKIQLKTHLLQDILEEHNAPNYIDFLSLDVDGAEYEILKSFSFDRYNIELICVEHNSLYDGTDKKNLIKSLLIENNYDLIKETIHDDFYMLKK
jgi:hypothetical protein